MEVIIKNVGPCSVDNSVSPPEILDFWVDVKLNNGQEIKIFDSGYNLQSYIGSKVQFLIYAEEIPKKTGRYKITGKFIRNYKLDRKKTEKFIIPEELSKVGITRDELFKDFIEGVPAIITENGSFLIKDDSSYKEDELITIDVYRFHLNYWYPIEK